MITKKQLLSFDLLLVLLISALAIFGIIIIGSATHINIEATLTAGEYESQIIWFSTGIFLMLIAAFIDYRFICKFYIFIYLINIALLVMVLFMGTGTGATRWVFGIQPSEFAKIFMILFLAKFIDKFNEKINNIIVVAIILLLTLLPVLLIQMQPSLSASLVIIFIAVAMLFAGKISYKYILVAVVAAVVFGSLIVNDLKNEEHKILSTFLEPYQIGRLSSAFNPDLSDPAYYQTKNSIWAIGSGQLNGKGLYNGTINQLSYLPESHNDFIFSVIGEEFGFVGCVGVLCLILLIILKCLLIAYKSIDLTGTLICAGVAGMFSFQTFVNVGVATGLLPNTGMPLPFVSYGGSSMWINMIAIGLVINVGMRKPKYIFEG